MIYSAEDLRTPVLMIVGNTPKGVTTTEIKNTLLGVLDVGKNQMKILAGRKDSKITQIIRNVICSRNYHVGLEARGLIISKNVDGVNVWKITPIGKAYLREQIAKYSAMRRLVP